MGLSVPSKLIESINSVIDMVVTSLIIKQVKASIVELLVQTIPGEENHSQAHMHHGWLCI